MGDLGEICRTTSPDRKWVAAAKWVAENAGTYRDESANGADSAIVRLISFSRELWSV